MTEMRFPYINKAIQVDAAVLARLFSIAQETLEKEAKPGDVISMPVPQGLGVLEVLFKLGMLNSEPDVQWWAMNEIQRILDDNPKEVAHAIDKITFSTN